MTAAGPKLHWRKVQQYPALCRAQAIEQFRKVGAQLELREFPDGALVVQTLSHSDAVVRALRYLRDISACKLSATYDAGCNSVCTWPDRCSTHRHHHRDRLAVPRSENTPVCMAAYVPWLSAETMSELRSAQRYCQQ